MRKAREEIVRVQEASKTAKNAASGFFGAFTGPLGAAAAGAAVAAFARQSAMAASAMQTMERRAQAVFGEAFPKMRQEADALGQQLGRSGSDLLSYQAEIAAIGKSVGISGEAMGGMSKDIAKLTADFGSFFEIADDEAFNLLQGALVGQTKALSRYGIVIDNAALQEHAHAKGIKTKVAEMSTAQQVLLRYEVLMEKTRDVQGDAAKNAENFANATKSLSAEWQDFQESAGTAFLPALAQGVGILTESLNRLMGSVVFLKNQLNVKIAEEQGLGVRTDDSGNVLLDYTAGGFRSRNEELMRENVAATADVTKDGTKNWKEYFNSLSSGVVDGEKGRKKLEEVREAMEELGESYEDQQRGISDDLKQLEMNHKERMQGIRGEIDKTKESMTDLKDEFQRSMRDMARSEADLIIGQHGKIGTAEEQLAELERERERAKQGGGSVSVKLQDDIDKKKKELEDLRADLTEAERLLGPGTKSAIDERGVRSDFGNQLADLRERRLQEQQQNRERLDGLNDELDKLEQKKSTEEEAYTIQRQQFELTRTAMMGFHDDYVAAMDNISGVTDETVKNLSNRLSEMRNLISQIDALMQARGESSTADKVRDRRSERLTNTPDTFLPKLAEGGIVTRPTIALIGEAGPEAVIPLGKGGAGISIVIQSMVVEKTADVDEVMSRIAREVRKQSYQSA